MCTTLHISGGTKKVSTLIALVAVSYASHEAGAFVVVQRQQQYNNVVASSTTISTRTMGVRTELNAIGVLARKAKEMSVRKYVEECVEDEVMDTVKEMKSALESVSLDDDDEAGPLQQALTKQKVTISLIAEYKRQLDDKSGYVDEIFRPEIMSPTFCEFGAATVAVMADERMGRCTYNDVKEFVVEQDKTKGEMTGPLHIISSDLIVDKLQIAQAAAAGAAAVTLTLGIVPVEKLPFFLKAAKALNLKAIVNVGKSTQKTWIIVRFIFYNDYEIVEPHPCYII
mmetsp:Transcript_23358/g.34450  ORF Transcript_23358/g.34450 Transcript_23358/m.34450 type:complete len:284 (-) Transcript_23358:2291-3142(-)